MQKEDLGRWEMNALLNKHSGLLGLSGVSNDMRAAPGRPRRRAHERARVAVDVFCYRLKKYIASYVGALGGVDVVWPSRAASARTRPACVRAFCGPDSRRLGIVIDPAR